MLNAVILNSGPITHAEMAASSGFYAVGSRSPHASCLCPCNEGLKMSQRVSDLSFACKSLPNLTSSRRGRRSLAFAVLADVPARGKNGPGDLTPTTTVVPPLKSSSVTASPNTLGLTETSMNSTPAHRLWVAFGAACTGGMVAKAVLASNGLVDIAGLGIGAGSGYVLADLATGIYHWGIDNYGDVTVPVFGSQIDAFQGHHRRPSTITKREFSNNVHAIARPVGLFLLPCLLLPSHPTVDTFLGVFLGLVIMSQQIHAWAHCRRSQVPPAVNFLQEQRILVSRHMHGSHHRPPYNINYCIVSGMWNAFLDESRLFLWLENFIFSRWGVAPRNWADAVASEWEQQGSYFEDGTDIPLDRKL